VNSDPSFTSTAPPQSLFATALWRGTAFFLLWMLLIQSLQRADLVMGVFVCIGATWVSLRLLPPSSGGLRFGRLLVHLPHFVWESVLAGVDVARRALHPGMPLQPGFVTCPLSFPPGFARNTFATITSLLPGSVAAGEVEGVIVYHCLDTSAPVMEQIWKEERLLARALVAGRHHG